MNQALKISAYVLGGATLVVVANQIYKRLNYGVGLLTTKEKMGKYVAQSSKGVPEVYTKDNMSSFLKFWNSAGDGYTKAWYQAVWKSEHGNETPYFYVGTKRHLTKGGTAG